MRLYASKLQNIVAAGGLIFLPQAWGATIADGVKSAGAEAATVFADAGTAAGPIISAIFIILAGLAIFAIVRSMMS